MIESNSDKTLNLQKRVIISLKKLRKIETSNLSLTGTIYSLKQNNPIEFESSLERDYIQILEYNNQVVRYVEQPIKIGYLENNIRRTYIPDFWVKYADDREEIIEIKYSKEIAKQDPRLLNKHNQADLFCKKNGLNFRILTEKEIRTPYLKNAKFLLYYRWKDDMVDNNHINLIFNKLKDHKPININDLLKFLSKDKYVQAECLFTLWYLISADLIGFNENEILSMNSIIWHKKSKKNG